MPELTRDGDVFVLDLGDGENRFNPPWVADVRRSVAEVAATEGPRALVTTARGKIWSNGLDLDWMSANPDGIAEHIDHVQACYAELLSAPFPTVAAIQGHCFAAGAMLALAHDQCFMRADRGFWCLPEVDIHIPFSTGMDALVRAKLTPATANIAMTTGRRFGGTSAAEAQVVTAAMAEEDLLDHAKAVAAELAPKAGRTLQKIRSQMYANAIELLGRRAELDLP